MLTIAWGFLKSRLGIGLIAAIALALLWARGTHYKNDRDAWKSAFAAQKAAMVAVQQQAQAKQAASDLATINTQTEYNRQLEASHAALEAARHDAVSQFVAGRRVRAEALGDTSSGTAQAGVLADPTTPADRRAYGDFVAIKPEEAEAISRTEMQNRERGDFLRGLVDQGLAIPDVGFGE